MTNPLITVGGVLGIGAVFVLLPVAVHTWQRYRYRKVVTCPETHQPAEIAIDTPRAALSSVFGRAKVRIRECSLWPKRKGCAQKCVSPERRARH